MTKLTDIDISKLVTLEADDLIHTVDVSDTTNDAAGTSKKIRAEDAKSYINDYEILETVVLAGGETEQDFILPSGYSGFLLKIDALKTNGSGTSIYCRTSKDGGATFETGSSDYDYGYYRWGNGSVTLYETTSAGASFIEFTRTDIASGNAHILLELRSFSDSSNPSKIMFHSEWPTSGSQKRQNGSGSAQRRLAQADNAIRIYPSSSTFLSGTLQLIGLK